MARVTTSVLPPPVQVYYDRVLLSMDDPSLIYGYAAEKRNLASRSGDIIRMERYDDIGTATVALGNTGVTPPNKLMSSVFVDAQIQWYGTWVEINEQVDLTSQSPVLNQRAKLLGRSMRQTEDELIKNMLATTAFAVFAVGGFNGDIPTEIALSDIQDVVKGLLGNDAKTVSDSINATTKYGTAPIPNAYVGMAHTDLSSSLENINGFTSTEEYSSQKLLGPSEWGTLGRVRFMLSSRGSRSLVTSALNATVYNTIITGMEAYTTVGLEKDNASFIYHDYKIAGGPLELNSTGGWKMSFAQAITNDGWIANLKSTL
ncbi:MAG TPA: N4-gp56 family major capsid protein [Methanosarcinales archaeon]|nr:N4-gp56 family major capsid protein [Methanosarcinales archaeon]